MSDLSNRDFASWSEQQATRRLKKRVRTIAEHRSSDGGKLFESAPRRQTWRQRRQATLQRDRRQ